jgi:FkbM family methyltransferase
MKKVFIDCGYHLGEGLHKFTELLNINSDWDVYAFEANPYCDINNKVIQHSFTVNAYNKAVWIEDGKAMFNCENQVASRSPKNMSTHELDGWGSCLDVINSAHSYETQVLVETIDFSKFLKQFSDNEVYIKMDIEGAEFEVLRKCINDKTYKIINTLWVEWHDVDIEIESSETILEIKNNLTGVNILDWE